MTFESRHLLELKLTQCVTALLPEEANHTHVEQACPGQVTELWEGHSQGEEEQSWEALWRK